MPYEIKKLTIDNYDQILEVWSLSGLPIKPKGRDSRELLGKELAMANVIMYGMYDGNKMIGVCIGNYDGRRGWINRLAVDPDYRGKKLAGELIDKCEQFLYSIGANIICALIEEENYPSISAFQTSKYKCEHPIKYFAKRPSADM